MKQARFWQKIKAVRLILQRTETDVMKRLLQIALVMTTMGLAGCVDNKYPISGEACGPDDPVRKLDANDCAVLPAG